MTVQFRPFGPSSLIAKDRPVIAVRTVHFWISGLSTSSFFGPSSLAHDRPLSGLRTFNFDPLGPFTLDLTPKKSETNKDEHGYTQMFATRTL